MHLPVAIVCVSHVAGALLGFGGRRRSLAALRTLALVSALAVVLAQLLPDALGGVGFWALAVFALGFAVPALLDRAAARLGKKKSSLALELGFAGLLAHQVADGLALGAYAGEAHDGHSHGDVLIALSAHTVPLVAVVTLAYQRRSGVRGALVRVAALLVATIGGIALTSLAPAAALERFEPWVTAAVAGLLLHVVVHDWQPERTPARPRERAVDLLAVIAGIGLVLLGGHDHYEGGVRAQIGQALWTLSLETAPALLLGLVAGALFSTWGASHLPSGWFGVGALRQAIGGASIGAPLPICACRVLPLAEGLRARGGPALVIAFLLATPELGLETFALTGSLIGWPFAFARLTAAVLLAIVAALVVHRVLPRSQASKSSEPATVDWSFPKRFSSNFDGLLVHVAPWMVAGLIVAAYAQGTLGEGFFTAWSAHGLDVLAVTLVALPSYVCAAAATPLAAVLLAKGMSPGAVLVGLVLGPAMNLATLAFLRRSYGLRAAIISVAVLVSGAWSMALVVNASGIAVVPAAFAATEPNYGMTSYGIALLLAGLLLRNIWSVGLRRWFATLGEGFGARYPTSVSADTVDEQPRIAHAAGPVIDP